MTLLKLSIVSLLSLIPFSAHAQMFYGPHGLVSSHGSFDYEPEPLSERLEREATYRDRAHNEQARDLKNLGRANQSHSAEFIPEAGYEVSFKRMFHWESGMVHLRANARDLGFSANGRDEATTVVRLTGAELNQLKAAGKLTANIDEIHQVPGQLFEFSGSMSDWRKIEQGFRSEKTWKGYSVPLVEPYLGEAELKKSILFDEKQVAKFAKAGLPIEKMFKKVGAAAVVAGAIAGVSSAASAATVRNDLPKGGEPVRVVGSNVGTTSGFESFQSSDTVSRISKTSR